VNYFPGSKPKALESRMARVKEHLEENLWQLEDLVKSEASLQSAINLSLLSAGLCASARRKKLNSL